MSVVRDLVVEVDGGQFYACRAGAEWASDRVTTAGYEQYLWTDGDFVYVGTTRRYGPTPVHADILDVDPGEPDGSWQHVVEVSLNGGRELEIYDWGADEPKGILDIDPGPVRLRVSWRGLVPGLDEGLDEGGNSTEELLLQTWPAAQAPGAVLRCWEHRALPRPTTVSPQGLRQVEGYESMMPELALIDARGARVSASTDAGRWRAQLRRRGPVRP